MSTDNTFNIKVAIGDRSYPLVVTTEQEEAVRKAAKSLNEKMLAFRENYAVTDKVDLLAMAALEYATEHAAAETAKKEQLNEGSMENQQLQSGAISQAVLELERLLDIPKAR
jgi:cell division protein ZapA